VKLHLFGITALLTLPLAAQTAPASPAPAPAGGASRVAIIQFQEAVLTTQEGQEASAALKAKFDPRKAALEKRQADLQSMQDKLQRGGTTMTAEARNKMQADLTAGGRNLNRDADDLNAEVQEEEGKIMQSMAAKMGEVIQKYAGANGYSVVLDVSSQQTPVLWAAQSANITADIVKQYDAAHPAKKAAAAAPAPKTQASR
jgi:outer membrane protein